MEPFKALNAAEQLAAHLRENISKGALSGKMPGIRRLAESLEVSSNTVTAALEQLEHEGFLVPQGQGIRSLIVLPEGASRPRFRVTLLPYESADIQLDYVVEIRRRLREDGHEVNVAEKSLVEMEMNIGRIARMVNGTGTDAWVVFSAPQDVLEWFVTQSAPTFALFGRFRRLPIAGTGLDKTPAFRAAIRRLVDLGHRRIVLIQPASNRKPMPALLVRETLEEMESHGIKTGPYNLPDWEQNPRGLRKCIDSLFAMSAPTAIIFDRPNELIGAQIYLAHKNILAPRDISLICDNDPAFEWCQPSISCIQWQSRLWASRVTRWVNNIASGKDDRRHIYSKAEFVERDSIGPAPAVNSCTKR